MPIKNMYFVECDLWCNRRGPECLSYPDAIAQATNEGWMIDIDSIICPDCYEHSLGHPEAKSTPKQEEQTEKTVYACECGAEFSTFWELTPHLPQDHLYVIKKLTRKEYGAWIDEQRRKV